MTRRLPVPLLLLLALGPCLGCRGPEAEPEPAVPERFESESPTDPVLIRADKWTEWHYVGRFLEQARKGAHDPSRR